MFSQTSLKDLFTPSLRSVSVLPMAILKSLTCASAILHFAGPTVVALLGSEGVTLSWVLVIVALCSCLSVCVCEDCVSKC